MTKDVVEEYTWTILKKQLQKFKISNQAMYSIIENVKEQLYSIIANWNDIEFRDTLLVIGSEEGTFYDTDNKLIANMVVVAIRNSLLEGVSSKSYQAYGSMYYLKDASIKIITNEAIQYFSKLNLEEIASTIHLEHDFYRDLLAKYPVAYKALFELSKCNEKDLEHEYCEFRDLEVYELVELDNIQSNEKMKTNYESGIDENFNDSLLNFLKDIQEKKSEIFYTDCFKMLTRNIEKLLRVIEFILTHNAMYITGNYLMTKNYVARRKNLIRASHTGDDELFYNKLESLGEVSKRYCDILENLKEFIN